MAMFLFWFFPSRPICPSYCGITGIASNNNNNNKLFSLRSLQNRTLAHYRSHLTLKYTLNKWVFGTAWMRSEQIFASSAFHACGGTCIKETTLPKFGVNSRQSKRVTSRDHRSPWRLWDDRRTTRHFRYVGAWAALRLNKVYMRCGVSLATSALNELEEM